MVALNDMGKKRDMRCSCFNFHESAESNNLFRMSKGNFYDFKLHSNKSISHAVKPEKLFENEYLTCTCDFRQGMMRHLWADLVGTRAF
jgi:hypothetical protein